MAISQLPIGQDSISLTLSGFPGLLTEYKMSKIRIKSDTDMAADTADGQPQTETLAPELLTPEQLENLKGRAAKADENWERLLRVTADLENFKKRAMREREEAIKFANESMMKRLIPVLDNFDMALAAANQTQANNAQSLQTGVAMIAQQLRSALVESGLEEVDAAGKPFDPNWHEAVSQQEIG